KTKTNKVSFIGGVDYPLIKEGAILFERGAKLTNPNITVITEWVGNWTDTKKCQMIAKNHIREGVDIISTNADPGCIPLHQLAQKNGIYTIGWIQDLYQLAPGTVLTSAIQDSPKLLLQAATLVRKGRWEGKQYKFGLREKVQRLAPFRGSLTAEQEEIVNKIKNDIITGKIDISS
ncbi:BMP family ABC transporter substrate-binding protein, partial [Planktothrix sp. FACHB-1355]